MFRDNERRRPTIAWALRQPRRRRRPPLVVSAAVSKIIHSMGMSLDGYIAGPDGDFSWGAPGQELHRVHNERVRELGAHFLGRRLYETMLPWETDPALAASGEAEHEFAEIWNPLPKVVFSTTLDRVEGNARLATGTIEEEVARLREELGDDVDIGVGGAGLAAAFMERGLVDEFQLFAYPVVLGGGTPFFPAAGRRVDLELLETRTLVDRVAYLRYRRA
jgi:dihydrofolate reductase